MFRLFITLPSFWENENVEVVIYIFRISFSTRQCVAKHVRTRRRLHGEGEKEVARTYIPLAE